jgi:hypothetical protein
VDTDEKSEASGEELEKLGPYLLEEQVQQSANSQEEFYRAAHETSGAAGLVLEHAAEEGAAPREGDWQVFLGCWASRGYSVMEVQHTPWARAQDRQSVESRLLTLESVLKEVRRMALAAGLTDEPRPRWRQELSVASVVAVCVLLFALVHLTLVSRPPSSSEPLASAPPGPMRHEVPTSTELPDPLDSGWPADTSLEEQPMLARPLPREPFKGQKRPPCSRYIHVELVGACWMPHELKAPCPEELYEYQGKCYAPVLSTKPSPQSLGQ